MVLVTTVFRSTLTDIASTKDAQIPVPFH
jgi:hypothetical protein